MQIIAACDDAFRAAGLAGDRTGLWLKHYSIKVPKNDRVAALVAGLILAALVAVFAAADVGAGLGPADWAAVLAERLWSSNGTIAAGCGHAPCRPRSVCSAA